MPLITSYMFTMYLDHIKLPPPVPPDPTPSTSLSHFHVHFLNFLILFFLSVNPPGPLGAAC